MNMPKATITLGIILILAGLAGYFGTGMASVTALIPAFFGVVFLILGVLASKKEHLRKHVMHATVMLAVLGIFGSIGGVIDLVSILFGSPAERPVAVIMQSIMAVACIVYTGMAVKSFIDARKAQQQT